jgi:hypothetical protein
MNIVYKLPKAAFSDELVQSELYDQDPEYVLAEGFVFVPLSGPYLRSWGPNWRQQAPFRLAYYSNGKVTPERLQRVVLSQVLPHPANAGYENLRYLVLNEVNGMKIKQISDIMTALKSPIGGFDIFKFDSGGPVEQVVLDASELDQANQEIMARYHIPADHQINADNPPMVQK